MSNCILHGYYSGSYCQKCRQSYYDSKNVKNPNFILSIIKTSLLMAVGIAIGWFFMAQ